jgi:hypothetical protein
MVFARIKGGFDACAALGTAGRGPVPGAELLSELAARGSSCEPIGQLATDRWLLSHAGVFRRARVLSHPGIRGRVSAKSASRGELSEAFWQAAALL